MLLGLINSLFSNAARATQLGPDDMLLGWMNDYRSHFFDCFFLVNTWAGSLFILLPLSSVIAATLFLRNKRLEAWLLGVGLGGAALVTQLAKHLFSRPRPEWFDALTPMPASWSFPSGHTTQIAAFSLCLAIITLRSSNSPGLYWFTAMLGFIVTVSVGISRLYLQVHYPSDVLAGVAIAILWVVGLYSLLNWIKETSPVF